MVVYIFVERNNSIREQRRLDETAARAHPADYATNAATTDANVDAAAATAATHDKQYQQSVAKDVKTIGESCGLVGRSFESGKHEQQCKVESETKGLEPLAGESTF